MVTITLHDKDALALLTGLQGARNDFIATVVLPDRESNARIADSLRCALLMCDCEQPGH